jgi:hypothetical protein
LKRQVVLNALYWSAGITAQLGALHDHDFASGRCPRQSGLIERPELLAIRCPRKLVRLPECQTLFLGNEVIGRPSQEALRPLFEDGAS